jgi:hypothetical protein
MYLDVSDVYPKMYLGLVWDTYKIHAKCQDTCILLECNRAFKIHLRYIRIHSGYVSDRKLHPKTIGTPPAPVRSVQLTHVHALNVGQPHITVLDKARRGGEDADNSTHPGSLVASGQVAHEPVNKVGWCALGRSTACRWQCTSDRLETCKVGSSLLRGMKLGAEYARRSTAAGVA